MTVVEFPKAKPRNEVPEIMVDFSISGGSVSMAGRLPVGKAVEKLQEVVDLLRAERDMQP